ncbi:DUF2937 family protein [uncultured Roseobacter sp.]|uniref:DUF2937 family protein n=1 Tax=uncultured Roseobacter sp. TaxID=114847 RepID=UPI00261C2EC7|nr:DUF2937 family protein [uncultured Roseobacter sp.]
MILRAITLAAGLTGAFAAAQFPSFSQQYLQRLGGAVDALHQVVADFDRSAAAEGLSRDQALAQLKGSDFLDRRRADMARSIARHSRLRADLAALKGQGPFMRATRITHLSDREIALRTWQAFEPAVPLTTASALFAIGGFALGCFGVGLAAAVLRRPRRRQPA